MVEATDAAVQKVVVVVASKDTALAHVAVERPGRNKLYTARALDPAIGLRLVVRLHCLLLGDQERDLILLFGGLRLPKTVHQRPVISLKQINLNETDEVEREFLTHLVETEHGDKNEADEDEILFRQQLQKWDEKLEEPQQVKARCDSEEQEEVRSGSSPVMIN